MDMDDKLDRRRTHRKQPAGNPYCDWDPQKTLVSRDGATEGQDGQEEDEEGDSRLKKPMNEGGPYWEPIHPRLV